MKLTVLRKLFGILNFCLLSGSLMAQGYNSVVITEILSDPTPVVGLPDAEYLELFNRLNQPVVLAGWQLIIGERAAPLPSITLPAKGYMLVSARTTASLLAGFGTVAGLAPFSLINAGSTLTLRNANGAVVHSMTYQDSWWPSSQRGGGYALEMIDTDNPCAGVENWRVSSSALGGTPNQPNSVIARNPDLISPLAERVEVSSPSQLKVLFNERLDSLLTIQSGQYALRGRTVRRSFLESPSFRSQVFDLDVPIIEGERYELTLKDAADCAGNRLQEARFTVGLPTPADSGDVIINEILFNPRANGIDFVELYNRSSKFISLKNWTLSSISNGVEGLFRAITTRDIVLNPFEFLALSTTPAVVEAQYPTERTRNGLAMSVMPSFPNDAGGVLLRDGTGRLFDRFDYQESFHSPLIADPDGVSLERIYPEKFANEAKNWQSASSVVGYATPGYANSQGLYNSQLDEVVVEPEAFTPDGDGIDDFTTIRFTSSSPGRIGSVKIYDVQGRTVRTLLSNDLLGTDGAVRWDGVNDRGEIAPMGYYLLLVTSFDASGTSRQYKKRVVVVRP